jgi:hypothetical protein
VPADEHPEVDFGRTELLTAVAKFSESESPAAYREFAETVAALEEKFSRDVAKEAQLRLAFLALRPLQAGLALPVEREMELLATTVWPTALDVEVKEGEGADAFVRRLCLTKLAITCKNVVPEEWAVLLSARVWRNMRNRARVAYGECQWCSEDRSFSLVLAEYDELHLRVELRAVDAAEKGRPSNWPVAGPHAKPLGDARVLSFTGDGWVRLDGDGIPGGAWRDEISALARGGQSLALHVEPKRLVADLLEFLGDAKRAGFQTVGLVVREGEFPYDRRQYALDTSTTNYRDFRIRPSDTVQILVQSLDHASAKTEASL